MRFEEFDPDGVPPGSSHAAYVDVTSLAGGDKLRLAVLVAQGRNPGPTIAVLGGVHGDEYEGQQAVREVFAALDPSQMAGTFIGVPESNVPAFAAASRASPIDGLNLARVFPGSEAGTVTELIAYYVANYIIARCSFLIDLHSAKASWPTMVGYYAHDSEVGLRSREAAFAFGAPVVWGHPAILPGRTISAATDRGIPWLYTECASGGVLRRDIARLYARGVTNVMKHLGILPGPVERDEPQYHFVGNGPATGGITARCGGFLLPEVDLFDRVRRGDLLGRVLGLAGEVLQEVRADCDGLVVFVQTIPPVHAGTPAFTIEEVRPWR